MQGAPILTSEATMVPPTLRLLMVLTASGALSAQADPAIQAKGSGGVRRDQTTGQARRAQVEFDAVALQALIAPMMMGNKEGPLGSGQAGRYWQSLMTEHIARHLAASGQLRLLPRLPNTPGAVRRATSGGTSLGWKGERESRSNVPQSWETIVRRATGDGQTHGDQTK